MSDTVDVSLTEEELDVIEMVLFKKNQAKVMLEKTDFPEAMDSATKASFFKGAGDLQAESDRAEKKWWTDISKKYVLDGQALSLNTKTGTLTKGT